MIFAVDHLDAAQLDLDKIQQCRNRTAGERHVSLLLLTPLQVAALYLKIPKAPDHCCNNQNGLRPIYIALCRLILNLSKILTNPGPHRAVDILGWSGFRHSEKSTQGTRTDLVCIEIRRIGDG